MVDFSLSYRFAPDDLLAWSGKELIVRRDEDILDKSCYQEAVGLLYPDAVFQTLPGEGQGARPEEEADVAKTSC